MADSTDDLDMPTRADEDQSPEPKVRSGKRRRRLPPDEAEKLDEAVDYGAMGKSADSFEVYAEVLKSDNSLGLVLGWGIISTEDGQPYWDLQGDHIPEDAMLKAACAFMQGERGSTDMHVVEGQGSIVFAWPMTAEIAKAFGIETSKTGLMVAMRPEPELLAKFQSGEYTGFSIGGLRVKDVVVEDEGNPVAKAAPRKTKGKRPFRGVGSFMPSDAEFSATTDAADSGAEKRYADEEDAYAKHLLAKANENHDEKGRFSAGELNAHLSSGGVVQVTTHAKSTLYEPKHAGHFSEKNGNLHVKYGRGTNQLSIGKTMLVGIRTGSYKKSNDNHDEHGRFSSSGGSGGGTATAAHVPSDVGRLKSEHQRNSERISQITANGRPKAGMGSEHARLSSRNSELSGLIRRASTGHVGEPWMGKSSDSGAGVDVTKDMRQELGQYTCPTNQPGDRERIHAKIVDHTRQLLAAANSDASSNPDREAQIAHHQGKIAALHSSFRSLI